MNSEKTAGFSELLAFAKSQLVLHPDAQQLIAVRTAKGAVRCFANDPLSGTQEEARFVQALQARQDAALELLVCVWADGSIDLPSMHLRRLLLAACPENARARMPLQGQGGITVRTIGQTMP